MKITSKTLLIAFVIVAIAVPLMLYQPVLANGVEEVEVDDVSSVKPRCRFGWRKKVGLVWRFLKNAEATEVKGEVVALERNILVLDVEGESAVNILVAPKWTDMEKVLESEVLFNDLLHGETITLKVLEASYTNPNEVTVSVSFGYEIDVEDDNYYAVLPFNIEIP